MKNTIQEVDQALRKHKQVNDVHIIINRYIISLKYDLLMDYIDQVEYDNKFETMLDFQDFIRFLINKD
jgi:hypothetical protein